MREKIYINIVADDKNMLMIDDSHDMMNVWVSSFNIILPFVVVVVSAVVGSVDGAIVVTSWTVPSSCC